MLHNVSQGNVQHTKDHELKERPSAQMLPTSSTSVSLPNFSQSDETQTEAVPFKLWEMDHAFRCPVMGICLDHSEQKQLLKKSGITFKDKTPYDIHMKGGGKHLENRLKRSDIVLCPVNCNSHAACTMVKNLGKKHNKPVHMLSSFSLSTVSQVIKICGTVQVA
jgi:hypothetical protein